MKESNEIKKLSNSLIGEVVMDLFKDKFMYILIFGLFLTIFKVTEMAGFIIVGFSLAKLR